MERPIFPNHPRRIAPCLRGVRGPEAPVIRGAAGRVLRELFLALECVFPFVRRASEPDRYRCNPSQSMVASSAQADYPQGE